MDISVFGLGYSGTVTAVCLASIGHRVTGVDVDTARVEAVNNGQSPIVEKGLPEMLKEARAKGLLHATADAAEAVSCSEASIICVGTPGNPNGSLNDHYIMKVSEDLGKGLRNKASRHILIFRSTLLPGTVRNAVIPAIEKISGRKNGLDFLIGYNPEFLRESTAVMDFMNPPFTVVGTDSEEAAELILNIYEGIPGPRIKTEIEIAEILKYACNCFHALKIVFANEMGAICEAVGIDSREVMNILTKDKKLNISDAYLKPGFAFGGSCLPKDLRAINHFSKANDIETPLVDSILKSNSLQIQNTVRRIISFGRRRIGIAGLSFKNDTDDLRESPIVEVAEALLGKGYDLKIYDSNMLPGKMPCLVKERIMSQIPHLLSFLTDSADSLLADRDVIIIGNMDAEFKRILTGSRDDQIVFDLAGIGGGADARGNYQGICW
jgi:GDP-mannose 6-dehydrogenase